MLNNVLQLLHDQEQQHGSKPETIALTAYPDAETYQAVKPDEPLTFEEHQTAIQEIRDALIDMGYRVHLDYWDSK